MTKGWAVFVVVCAGVSMTAHDEMIRLSRIFMVFFMMVSNRCDVGCMNKGDVYLHVVKGTNGSPRTVCRVPMAKLR